MTPQEHSDNLEDLRREPSDTEGLTSEPLLVQRNALPFLFVDYAAAGLKIDRGVSHMDESVPNKQKLRTEAAFRAMNEGLVELGIWLRANGYEV